MKRFYAYLHEDGSLHVRRDMGDHDMGLLDAQDSPFVVATTTVYEAATEHVAKQKALMLLADAIDKNRMKRIEKLIDVKLADHTAKSATNTATMKSDIMRIQFALDDCKHQDNLQTRADVIMLFFILLLGAAMIFHQLSHH